MPDADRRASPRSLTGVLRFRGLVLNPEGTEWHEIEKSGAPEDAVSIGASSGRELLALAGPNFLATLTAR